MIRKLIKEYGSLSEKEQEKVESIHEYLVNINGLTPLSPPFFFSRNLVIVTFFSFHVVSGETAGFVARLYRNEGGGREEGEAVKRRERDGQHKREQFHHVGWSFAHQFAQHLETEQRGLVP